MPTRDELTAANKSVEEIKEFMGVDILMYQELEDLKEAVTRKGDHNIDRPCMACLDGWYVTGNIDEKTMKNMEAQRTIERSQLK
jgi:amidophosphoribosyltransferase